MGRVMRNISGWIMSLSFALSPVILIIMYLTYSEKIVVPILMLVTVLSIITFIITDERK